MTNSNSDFYALNAVRNDGKDESMAAYKGKVLLVVNTASKCGFTPQYEGLQELYTKHHAKGFEVLAFPCDQFGNQEPGSDAEIAEFCQTNFSISFPIFQKTDVNGKNTHPVFQWLKQKAPGFLNEAIKWNFTKFLVDQNGNVIKRYASMTTPKEIEADILSLFHS